MKLNVFQLIKMTIGFMIGMLIAMLFELPYFFTAGVIVVLSLEPTRKASTTLSIIRVIDSLLSLGLAILMFYVFGFNIWVLFVFVAIFIPISFLLNLQKGIVVSLVLISQIYLEQNLMFGLNALYILIIGVGVALLLNLYMPKNRKLELEITTIDQAINLLIQSIANQEDIDFQEIELLLNTTYQNIQIELENINVPLTTKRLKYIEMRLEQVSILKRINQILNSVIDIPEKTIILNFLKTFDNKIGEDNYAASLEVELNNLLDSFKKTELPDSRQKFENRAQLYYVLLEIDQFLKVKLLYHQNLE